jgi:hypothetical protein
MSLIPMTYRPRLEEQDDQLRPRLIDPLRKLVQVAALINWEIGG